MRRSVTQRLLMGWGGGGDQSCTRSVKTATTFKREEVSQCVRRHRTCPVCSCPTLNSVRTAFAERFLFKRTAFIPLAPH
ncbi:hypothetical protein LSTR_LSTR001048 [Laodelphax striatellus]|uniref:Uncharacterized protein n=1 Tax=Laodelphax striatellus TaxID=195883 RepID=A0A482X102_LAOST|nr:hypothetical protein LSTR_LSTR001048 [Laodelphax striatellus]